MGGCIESDAKALTVVPCGRRPSIAVTTVTGVATPAITSRKAEVSGSFSDAAIAAPWMENGGVAQRCWAACPVR
ncbi:hypothetical protein GCM10017744_089660 [Streptomyces antimycoticus]